MNNFMPYTVPTSTSVSTSEPSTLELRWAAISELAAQQEQPLSLRESIRTGREVLRKEKNEKRLVCAELTLAVRRMDDAGWPGMTTEYVQGEGPLGLIGKIIPLLVIQLCGDPLESYLEDKRVNYFDKPVWLGRDSRLYALNDMFWLAPSVDFAPIARANRFGNNRISNVDSVVAGLRALPSL